MAATMSMVMSMAIIMIVVVDMIYVCVQKPLWT